MMTKTILLKFCFLVAQQMCTTMARKMTSESIVNNGGQTCVETMDLLRLKDHQDAAKKLATQHVVAFHAQFDALRVEFQATCGLLQNQKWGGDDQGALLCDLCGDAFSLARITEARLEDQSALASITTAKRFPNVGNQRQSTPRLGGTSLAVSTPKSHFDVSSCDASLRMKKISLHQMQALLDPDEVPTTLPPHCSIDYRIHLLPDTKPVNEHQFYVKRSKCVFGAETLGYLGHTISGDGVRMDPNKIKAVWEWPNPTTQRQVRGFLGLAGYYRHFIKVYATMAAPLTDLVRKDGFEWGVQEAPAFEELIQRLSTTPVEYKSGISNQATDALSRMYEDEETVSASCMALSQPVVGILANLNEENASLEELRNLHHQLDMRAAPIRDLHDTPCVGHEGVKKMLEGFSTLFYWTGMRKSMDEYVKQCLVCQQTKYSMQAMDGYLQPLPTPYDVWEDVSMDFITGLPVSKGLLVILVVVDRFSKLPLSLIPYLAGSSKVAVVEELLVERDGLMWRLKQNLVEARNKMEVKANRNGEEAITELPKEFQEGQSLEKPMAICDSRLVVHNGSLVQQVLVQWDGRSPEEATWEWMSDFKDTYPSYNLKDKLEILTLFSSVPLVWFKMANTLDEELANSLSNEEVSIMATSTGCAPGSLPFTYLGLPIGSNMNLISNWQPLIDRFQSRLSSWKANMLSIGGRLTLIKAVLGSLGIYYLSIFKAPELILKALERYRATFFWGGSHDNKKIAWIKWSNVLSSFDKGGLNIGSLKAFNLALLQKWRWRMHSCPNAFWVKIIKALHGKEGGFDVQGCNFNSTWSRIIGSSNYLYSIGIIPFNSLCFRIWPRTNIGVRNKAYLRDLLTEISLIDINVDEDSCVWSIAKDDIFTVAETRRIIDYMLLPSLIPPTSWYKVLPRKVNIFLWRLYLDRLPHRLNLSSYGLDIQSISCPMCNGNVESSSHILFECDIASEVWRMVRNWCDIPLPSFSSHDQMRSWLCSWQVSKEKNYHVTVIFASLCWWLWRYRNNVSFCSHPMKKSDLFDNIRSSSYNLLSHRGCLTIGELEVGELEVGELVEVLFGDLVGELLGELVGELV
ncbi:RNA-directed DNA polymerase, eukaryota, reverse transcriptase zinc-binding domain protein [Tanacetum coccineum]